jgi:hypothetical protein
MVVRKKEKKAPEKFHFEEGGVTAGWVEDMRNLGQEIVNSFDARVARVKALGQETAALLTGFHDEMKQKAADLKRFLKQSEASRMRDFKAMHEGIRTRQEERNREVANMLGGFRRENEAAHGHWRNMAATMARRRASFAR